jgi:nicotianamine synthase
MFFSSPFMNPLSTTKQAKQIKDQLCHTHHELICYAKHGPEERSQRLESLFKTMDVLTAFGPGEIETILKNDPEIRAMESDLRSRCCAGEYELERLWAERISTAPDARAELLRFPFFEDYTKLAHFNANAVQLSGPARISRVLFVGSGPLPLSAYLLAQQQPWEVDCLDISPEAINASRRFFAAVGESRLQVIESDILAHTDLKKYDAIFLAALVGNDEGQKRRIFEHLHKHMRSGARLLVRTSHHLRTLYYTHVKPEDLKDFKLHAEIHPLNGIVNSVIIAEKI